MQSEFLRRLNAPNVGWITAMHAAAFHGDEREAVQEAQAIYRSSKQLEQRNEDAVDVPHSPDIFSSFVSLLWQVRV